MHFICLFFLNFIDYWTYCKKIWCHLLSFSAQRFHPLLHIILLLHFPKFLIPIFFSQIPKTILLLINFLTIKKIFKPFKTYIKLRSYFLKSLLLDFMKSSLNTCIPYNLHYNFPLIFPILRTHLI